MIDVEVVFNKDVQHLDENGFENLGAALDRLTGKSGNHWDFGTGASALGSCSQEAHEALRAARKSRQRLHAGIWIKELREFDEAVAYFVRRFDAQWEGHCQKVAEK